MAPAQQPPPGGNGMSNLARTVGDFEATQAVAIRQGTTTARIITYAGNPNGATITPTPTMGTICIDSTSGNIWQWVSGTTWIQFTTGTLSATGLDWKQSVLAASTANVPNPTSAAPSTLDGVTLVQGARILLKNQTNGAQNGIYVVTTLGTGANGVWAFAPDYATGTANAGCIVEVEQSSVASPTQAGTLWLMTTAGTVTIGTTATSWVNFGSYYAGSGIAITTGVITAVADPNGGLSVTGTGIKALAANTAISVSSSGVGVALATTPGLTISSGLAVLLASGGGLSVTGSGIGISVSSPNAAGSVGGLSVSATGIGLSLDAIPGLQTTTGLKVLADPAGAIAVGSSGIKVNVDSSNGSTAISGNAIIVPGVLNKTIASATASQVVDSVPIATYTTAQWVISVKNSTTGHYSSEILACNLGTGTTVDYAEYGVVQLGSFTTNVPSFTVTNDGTNMILTFTGDVGNSISVNRQAVV